MKIPFWVKAVGWLVFSFLVGFFGDALLPRPLPPRPPLPLSLQMPEFYGDGIGDDAPAIQAAFDSTMNGGNFISITYRCAYYDEAGRRLGYTDTTATSAVPGGSTVNMGCAKLSGASKTSTFIYRTKGDALFNGVVNFGEEQ